MPTEIARVTTVKLIAHEVLRLISLEINLGVCTGGNEWKAKNFSVTLLPAELEEFHFARAAHVLAKALKEYEINTFMKPELPRAIEDGYIAEDIRSHLSLRAIRMWDVMLSENVVALTVCGASVWPEVKVTERG